MQPTENNQVRMTVGLSREIADDFAPTLAETIFLILVEAGFVRR